MDIEVFNYNLPMELIASILQKTRSFTYACFKQNKNTIEDHYFYNILDFSVLVMF